MEMAPRPLVNLGNTCFANSILQPLARVDSFKQYFVNGEGNRGEGPMTKELRRYLTAQWDTNKQNVELSPTALIDVMGERNRRFRGRRQQDAHEALRVIFEAIIEEERKRVRAKEIGPPVTELEKLITGTLVATVQCEKCGGKSEMEEPFLDLPLQLIPRKVAKIERVVERTKSKPGPPPLPPPLPPAMPQRKNNITQQTRTMPIFTSRNGLGSLFGGRKSTTTQTPPTPPAPPPPKPSSSSAVSLDTENAGFASMKESIQEFMKPQILAGDNSYACDKCKTKTRATRTVSIRHAPKLFIIYFLRFGRTSSGRLVKRNGHVEFSDSFKLNNDKYRLVGVTKHGGSLHGGHYVSMVRGDDGWWLCNDSRVRRIDAGKVFNSEAYLLFYESV